MVCRSCRGGRRHARYCHRRRQPAHRKQSQRLPPPCKSDAGQLPQARLRRRESAPVVGNDGLGAGVEVTRPCIIAEPGPLLHDRLRRRGGQRGDIRPALAKSLEIGLYRRDRRLLEHDLREPDEIRIGGGARQGPPGQNAAMAIIPGEQRSCRRFRAQAAKRPFCGLSEASVSSINGRLPPPSPQSLY